MRLTLLSVLAAVAAASPVEDGILVARGCNHNNCLRAVIASAFTTRSGVADCSSYFKTTVTPATSTVTVTDTVSTTPTVVLDATASDLVEQTATQVQDVTVTVTASTTTVYTPRGAANPPPTNVVSFVKRQQTESPSKIPAYASACSGAVKYSSACSCVGVTPTTITADASVTTTTATVTVTPGYVTQYTTVATDVFTTTDATVTVVGTTATVSVVATVTAEAFSLKVTSGRKNGKYIGLSQGLASNGSPLSDPSTAQSSSVYSLAFVDTPAQASRWYVDDATGSLHSVEGQGRIVRSGNSFAWYVYIAPANAANDQSYPTIVCALSSSGALTCHEGGPGSQATAFSVFWDCYNLVALSRQNSPVCGGQPLTLEAL